MCCLPLPARKDAGGLRACPGRAAVTACRAARVSVWHGQAVGAARWRRAAHARSRITAAAAAMTAAAQVGAQPWVGRAGGQRAFQPVLPFLEEPAGHPEPAQRPGQPRPGLAVLRQRPAERGAEVILLAGQHGQVTFALREREERLGVPPPGLSELSGAEVPQRPAQPVQPPHHQRVPGPQLLQASVQLRAPVQRPGGSIGEHPPAPSPGQRVALQAGVLLRCRNPGIPQQLSHTRTVPKPYRLAR